MTNSTQWSGCFNESSNPFHDRTSQCFSRSRTLNMNTTECFQHCFHQQNNVICWNRNNENVVRFCFENLNGKNPPGDWLWLIILCIAVMCVFLFLAGVYFLERSPFVSTPVSHPRSHRMLPDPPSDIGNWKKKTKMKHF